ncbi:DEAD/DEAH box helicase [Roseiconus nitratireducens]|uniref:DEAD/DEAH box helicase n=1 Tax=Roseiconus nitratireducens TaxID=2605748 RepID=UPI001F171643|nr:helicase-related protein [Roseiconus nitratireducens]
MYNLQVSGHPSYYAHGVLSHNCHLISRAGDGMYRQFLADCKVINPHVRVIGLTATPFRLDSGMICSPDHFLNSVCYEIGIKELIRDGYLCPLVSKAGINRADFSSVHTRAGEFVSEEVEQLAGDDALVSAACAEIVELTADRRAVLIFATSVAHGRQVVETLRDNHGIECGFVTGQTPAEERDALLARFRGDQPAQRSAVGTLFDTGNGTTGQTPLRFLCNVNVLTTGFDAPRVDCVVMLRPTMSPGLLYQCVGRGFRLHPDKQNCLVLDFGGNIERHGPIDQIKPKEKQLRPGSEPPAKECEKCHALVACGYANCPECGHPFPPPDRESHDAQASDAGVLSGEVTDTEYEVRDVIFRIHRKRDADEDAPRCLRVDYMIGLDHWQSEFICIEHSGYARRKAEAWWRERCLDPCPTTAEDALELADVGLLATPESITVRSISGQKYDRIIKQSLGEIPSFAMTNDEDDPVPF